MNMRVLPTKYYEGDNFYKATVHNDWKNFFVANMGEGVSDFSHIKSFQELK